MTRFLTILSALVPALMALAALGCDSTRPAFQRDTRGLDITGAMEYSPGDLPFDTSGAPIVSGAAWRLYDARHAVQLSEPRGFAWIRYRVPPNTHPDPAIYIPGGNSWGVFEAYVGAVRIYRSSRRELTSTERTVFFKPHIIPLPPGSSGATLYFRYYITRSVRFGILDAAYLNSGKSVITHILWDQLDRVLLGFIFILSGIITLALFAVRWQQPIYPCIGFALMCVPIGLFAVTSSDLMLLYFISGRFARLTTFISALAFPVGLFAFIEQTIGAGYRSFIRRAWQLFLALGVAAAAASLLDTVQATALQPFMSARSIILALAAGAAGAHVVGAMVRGDRPARIIGAGLLAFGFAEANDMLFRLRIVDVVIVPPHWGLFALMLLLGYLLFDLFEQSRRKLQQYSVELRDKSEVLADLNRTLEERVQERTEELSEKNQALKAVNEQLLDRNTSMEAEVAMARRIQQQLIPSRMPMDNIAAIYRPMDLVGGDFYDFYQLGGPYAIGVFICDVSGHGVPAAFITSMIKTTILQAGALRDDPAGLIAYLNDVLYGKTAGHFITAFYGIVGFGTMTMRFANAGHNPPFLITDGEMRPLAGKRSVPIGLYLNENLERLGKSYRNDQVALNEVDKILFYTDGLTETVNARLKSDMFEYGMLPSVIRECGGYPSERFVNELFARLTEFRGSESFEDDVCIICADVRRAVQPTASL